MSLPKLGDVHVKCELVAEKSVHLILAGAVHHVQTRTNVGGCRPYVVSKGANFRSYLGLRWR